MEIDDKKDSGNGDSHLKNIGNSHQSIVTGLQNTSQQVKCQEEKLENDKSCIENKDSNSQNSDSVNKNVDTEESNCNKDGMEVREESLGNLNSYFENADKIYIFGNTDSHFQDVNDGRFVDMINIRQEHKYPQEKMSELENKTTPKDMKNHPSFEDTALRTERSESIITANNSNLEVENIENSDIDFENRHVETEHSHLKIENGPIMNVHANEGAVTLLTPSELHVSTNCPMGGVLSSSESHPPVVARFTQTKADDHLGTFKCNFCDKKFKHELVLNRHKIIHSAERPYLCSVCNKGFKAESYLKGHQRMVHSADWSHQCTCTVCNKRFRTLSDLKRHKTTHSKELVHKCNVCDKGFKSVAELRGHDATHSNEALHGCNVCGKRFKTLEVLRVHVTRHSTRPHQCNICDKAFKTETNLRQHMFSHSAIGAFMFIGNTPTKNN